MARAVPPSMAAPEQRLLLLDGIRGYASISVLLYHTLPWLIDWISPGTGKLLSRFVAFDGMLAVYIFFVISGCSLSIGFLRSGNPLGIAHLAIRRLPRLCIPIFVSCGIAYVLAVNGWMFNAQAGALANSSDWLGSFYRFAPFFFDLIHFSFGGVFFAYDPTHSFNPVLWTMPPELGGSAMVFALLVFRWFFGRRYSAYIFVGMALLALRSPLLAFLLGMVISEELISGPDTTLWRSHLFTFGFFAIVIARLAGISLSFDSTVLSLVAAALVFCIIRSGLLRPFFLSPTAKLAGRLSFPLYLVHTPLLSSVSSYAFLQLVQQDISKPFVVAATAVLQITCSFAAAFAFLPVEEFAKHFSRRLSGLMLRQAQRSEPEKG